MAGGHRGQRAPESSLSAAAGAERGPRPEVPGGRAGGQSPTPSAPPQASSRGDARPARPGPWCSTGAAAGARESPRSQRKARALPLTPSGPSPHSARAPARPRPPGSARASGSASGQRGHPLGWPASPPRAASPGATRKLSAQVCASWKKRFPLQCTKAKRSGRALKGPGWGGGWLEAWERCGGAGLRPRRSPGG